MKKIIFLMLFTLSWPTLAQRWFDVEILAFRHNISSDKAGERWPSDAGSVNTDGAIRFDNTAGLAKYEIEPLSKSQLELTDQYNQLINSGKYKGILHVGWRQDDRGKTKLPKIRLSGGKKLGSKNELDGFIRLYVDHYLFAETDLVLRQNAKRQVSNRFDPNTNNPKSSGTENYLQSVKIKQKRRMRSGEIHYIDHPLMGIIIQVRKLDQDE